MRRYTLINQQVQAAVPQEQQVRALVVPELEQEAPVPGEQAPELEEQAPEPEVQVQAPELEVQAPELEVLVQEAPVPEQAGVPVLER